MSTTLDVAHAGHARRTILAGVATGGAIAFAFAIYLQLGLPVAVALILIPVGLAATLWFAPAALAAIAPALLPLPTIGPFFPYELAFGLLAVILALRAVRTRDASWWTLSHQETVHLLLLLWGLFSVLWIFDPAWFIRGVRRLGLGLVTYFVARRMAGVVPIRVFHGGLMLAAITLGSAAQLKRLSLGLSSEQASLRRAAATDLGWGTANFIATILLLLSPVALELFRRERGTLRVLAGVALGLITYMQGVIASRAAGLLWLGGTAMQLLGRRSRMGGIGIVAVLIGVVAYLASPLGQSILLRFTSVRELGSMAVRVWYFRTAWERIVEFFPWGMGLNQGWSYPDRLFNVDPHNYWLAMAFELGVPGVALWLAVLIMLRRRLREMSSHPEWHDIGRALTIAFWLGMLHTLVEPTFQGPQYQFVFFWVMGGSIGYYEASLRPRRASAVGSEMPSPIPRSSR